MCKVRGEGSSAVQSPQSKASSHPARPRGALSASRLPESYLRPPLRAASSAREWQTAAGEAARSRVSSGSGTEDAGASGCSRRGTASPPPPGLIQTPDTAGRKKRLHRASSLPHLLTARSKLRPTSCITALHLRCFSGRREGWGGSGREGDAGTAESVIPSLRSPHFGEGGTCLEV